MTTTNNTAPVKKKSQTELDLYAMKDKYINNLRQLLKNPQKKEVKVLQAEAEELASQFKLQVSQYKKNRMVQIEEEVHKIEIASLNDLEAELNKI